MSFGGGDKYDSLNSSAVYGALSVGTAAVEVKVGVSPLEYRKMVHMFAEDNEIYWGYNSGVTTANGTRIYKNQFIELPIGPDIAIYVVADGAGKSMRIAELA